MARADLVYSDEEGNVFAECHLESGKVLHAIPDGEGGVKWSRTKEPLGTEGVSVLPLLAKAFCWGP